MFVNLKSIVTSRLIANGAPYRYQYHVMSCHVMLLINLYCKCNLYHKILAYFAHFGVGIDVALLSVVSVVS